MSLRAIFLIAVALVAPGAPEAARAAWSVVVATESYFVEFDPDLVRRQGPYTMAWTRMTFTVPQPGSSESGGRRYQSQLQLHAIDCEGTASTVVGLVLYTGALGRGDIVERTTRPRTEWTPKPAPSGSLGERTVRLACAAVVAREPR